MIHVSGLRYTYAGTERPALRGLDFAVEEREVFGFLGPSGAGKSSTQKVLIGLLDDYSGEATVLGQEVKGWGSELYKRIGVAAETPNLYRKLTGGTRSPVATVDRGPGPAPLFDSASEGRAAVPPAEVSVWPATGVRPVWPAGSPQWRQMPLCNGPDTGTVSRLGGS